MGARVVRLLVLALVPAIVLCALLLVTLYQPQQPRETARVWVTLVCNEQHCFGEKWTGYVIVAVADREEQQRKAWELVRPGDLGVLYVFRELPGPVCLTNTRDTATALYMVRAAWADLATLLEPGSTWCTFLLKDEMLFETTQLHLPRSFSIYRVPVP